MIFRPQITLTITAPDGLLVGDTATATAVAMGDDGRHHPGRPRHWSSSDPSAPFHRRERQDARVDRRPLGDHLVRGRRSTPGLAWWWFN